MGDRERIVAVGLLSERELAVVGQTLRRVYRVDGADGFDDLLRAIDVADEQCGCAAMRMPTEQG